MSEFDTLVQDAQAFCATLATNNNKGWWDANKATYDAKLKRPALALLEAMTAPLKEVTGHDATPKLFRPYRDVRFSKDKTPYQTHLHMMWSLDAGGRQDPVIFFGIDIDSVTFGGGVVSFDKEVLADWRKMIDLDGDRIGKILETAEAQGFGYYGEALKRVPPPFPKNHPQAEHLKRKGLVLTRPLASSGPLTDRITAGVGDLVPVLKMLDSVL